MYYFILIIGCNISALSQFWGASVTIAQPDTEQRYLKLANAMASFLPCFFPYNYIPWKDEVLLETTLVVQNFLSEMKISLQVFLPMKMMYYKLSLLLEIQKKIQTRQKVIYKLKKNALSLKSSVVHSCTGWLLLNSSTKHKLGSFLYSQSKVELMGAPHSGAG